jgi:SNF2 family DNA or RNA helicase
VAFVGVTDSWEAYYQAVRRCYRFGQKQEVHVHIFASEQEGSIVSNLKRKESDAKAMGDALATEVMESVKSELFGQTRESNEYQPRQAMNLPSFLRHA